ncbi:MAG: Gfo/Idh/MocA family oxidoreductase [Candidatus Bathyarchaeota archaeon]|nr:Gfo/Idh/MocA family oxidoreductase [Candidatus Bathyarchaeota archaeon]
MKTLGVGVIGVGFWGKNHARVYNEIKKARLVGVSDLDKTRAKDLASKYKCGFYEKNHQLLKDDEIDAVSICTPTSTHFEIALQTIENGKHVLVEKPLGRNLKESVKIVREAEKKGVKLTVGHIERFNPAVQKLKELVEEGTIGDIILILSRRVTRWPERIGDVGVVKDSAIHDIDVMRYILEDDVVRVYAKVGKLKHRFEDYAEALLHFNKGGTGFIDSNWLTPKKIRNLIVTGSEATASLDYLNQQISIESSKFVKKVQKKWKEPLKLELNHFVEVVLDNKEPCVTGLDGIKAIQICESIIKSGASGKVINLKPIAI